MRCDVAGTTTSGGAGHGDRHRWHGRAVDTSGEPVANAILLVELLSVTSKEEWEGPGIPTLGVFARDTYGEFGDVWTDLRGNFEFEARLADESRNERSLILSRMRNEPVAIEAQLPLRGLESEVIDLGEVCLAPAPLLVAGRVVDPDGTPIGDAAISVHRTSRGGSYRIHTTSAADGTFVLRGIQGSPDCEFSVSADDHLDRSSLTATVGTRDFVVVLSRGGGVKGRIEVPIGVSLDELLIAIERRTEPGGEARIDRHTLGGSFAGLRHDGTFAYDELLPATWALVIESRPNQLLLEREFEVRSGETTDLGILSLADTARTIVLKVIDAVTGVPLEGGYIVSPSGCGETADLFGVKASRPTTSGFDGPREFSDGSVRIVTVQSPTDVVIGVTGRRSVIVTAKPGEQEVALAAGIPIRLRIADFAGLPPESQQVLIKFRPRQAADDRSFEVLPRTLRGLGLSTPFDAAGCASAALPGPGTWVVWWQFRELIKGEWESEWFFGREREIVIRDGESPPELLLHADRNTSKGRDSPKNGRRP